MLYIDDIRLVMVQLLFLVEVRLCMFSDLDVRWLRLGIRLGNMVLFRQVCFRFLLQIYMMLCGCCSGCVGIWYLGVMWVKLIGCSCWQRCWLLWVSGLIRIVVIYMVVKLVNNVLLWLGWCQCFICVVNSGSSEISVSMMKLVMQFLKLEILVFFMLVLRWYSVVVLSLLLDSLLISYYVLSISSSSENVLVFYYIYLLDVRNSQYSSNSDNSSIQSIGSFGSDGVVVMDVVLMCVYLIGVVVSIFI